MANPCGYENRKCGADIKTASVAIIVNSVKMIRHNRSTTIAANFQSFVISPFSSSFRSYCGGWREKNGLFSKIHINGWRVYLIGDESQFL